MLVAVPFLYVGFDVIPQSAGEINLPFKRIGMLTVAAGFPASVAAEAELPTADAMAALWDSQVAGNILLLGGVAGILTSWNGFMIGASRLLYAMGESGMLPRWFGRLHPK